MSDEAIPLMDRISIAVRFRSDDEVRKQPSPTPQLTWTRTVIRMAEGPGEAVSLSWIPSRPRPYRLHFVWPFARPELAG